jgi:hypothetical protein
VSAFLDDAGKILKEVKVASEPQALLKVLGNPSLQADRTGSRAVIGLFSVLAEAELPVICVETAAHAGGAEGGDQQDRPQ